MRAHTHTHRHAHARTDTHTHTLSPRAKGIRVSMHHNGPNQSKEAFSYLRFVHARGSELMLLPSMNEDTDLGKTPIDPIR